MIGVYFGAYLKFRPTVVQDSFATLFRWYFEGRIKPHISHTLPLRDVAEGMRLMKERKSTGKIVITP